MAAPLVTKRPGRKAYYARLDGRYVSTGETDQRLALQAASRMQLVGVDAYRRGKRALSDRLADLIPEHLDYLRERDGRNNEHIRKKRQQLMAPVHAGAMRVLRDVTKQRFESWWRQLACGPKTRNEYLTAWRVFLKWLVDEERLASNPLEGRVRWARVPKVSENRRRAFSVDELARILDTAEKWNLLYLFAATTGARFNECRQLRWDDVHEGETPPYVTLRPETTKNGKGRIQVLTAECNAALAESRVRAKTERVFRSMPSHHTVNKDLARAGIEKRTSAGVACFHSFRHTFTTLISRVTGDVRLAKEMAGHADIATTQGYLHTEITEHADAIARFPSLRATGRATEVVQRGLSESHRGVAGRDASGVKVASREALRPGETGEVSTGRIMEPGGIEPPCRNSQP